MCEIREGIIERRLFKLGFGKWVQFQRQRIVCDMIGFVFICLVGFFNWVCFFETV